MPRMSFQFLDVGMGDGTLVLMGDTDAKMELALIDFGVHKLTKFKVGKDDAKKYLTDTIGRVSKARKDETPYLNHLFITHPHEDHYNAIKELITAEYPGYAGKKLLIGRLTYGGPPELYGDLIAFIKEQVVFKTDKLVPLQHSPIIDGEVIPYWTFCDEKIKVYLLCSNVPLARVRADYNQLSLCLMFEDQNHNKMILMGDAGFDIENQIMEFYTTVKPFLNAYGLKMGHHGSNGSTSDAWVAAVKPKAAFATGDMVWAHPYCNALDRVSKTVERQIRGKHWFCCGKSAGRGKREYKNNESDLLICLNIWYFVDDEDGEMMMDEGGESAEAQAGLTYGVQWELEFDRNNITFRHTDASVPADAKKS